MTDVGPDPLLTQTVFTVKTDLSSKNTLEDPTGGRGTPSDPSTVGVLSKSLFFYFRDQTRTDHHVTESGFRRLRNRSRERRRRVRSRKERLFSTATSRHSSIFDWVSCKGTLTNTSKHTFSGRVVPVKT